jgi:4-amino-4-deoxy-L-arabinose transferase-like glycosyltransferase
MLLLTLIVGIFLVLRLLNLTLIPIFADEAIYIRWSQLILKGQYFIPLSDGKTPLFMWLLTPMLKIVPDPLVAGRLLSIIAGLGTLFAVYLLTKKLFNQKTALLATSLVALNPFLLFYDRLSLVDSLLTTLIIWSFLTALSLFKKPSLKQGILLGLLWAAALLTKPSATLFIILTPSLLLLEKPKKWLEKIKSLVLPGGLAGIISLSIYSLLRFSKAFHLINSRSADYLRTSSEFFSSWLEFFPDTLRVYSTWLVSYFSLIGLVLLFYIWLLSFKHRKTVISLLGLWVVIPILIQVSIGKIVHPRYLLPIVPFMLIIIAWGVNKLKWFGWGLLLVIILTWVRFDYLLLTDPLKAPLPTREQTQYFFEWSAGYGLKEITDYLNHLPEDQSILVATEGSFGTLPNGLEIYFNQSPNIRIQGIGFPNPRITEAQETALVEGRQVYLVFNQDRLGEVDHSRLELIKEYPRTKGEVLLFFKVLPK